MGVTIYDIAEQAGVSIATVSRVLNDRGRVAASTRQRVADVAEALGYQPHASAQSLARREAHMVAAVIPMLTTPFFVQVMRGMQDRLMETQFDLLVYATPSLRDIDVQLDRAMQRGLAAGVLLFSTPLSEAQAERLHRSTPPVVMVDSCQAQVDCVRSDNVQGGYIATQHLLEQGCRHIALVRGHADSVPSQDREKGYRKALREAGLTVDPALVAVAEDEHRHGYTEEAGRAAIEALLQAGHRPDGIFVTSDLQALGVLQGLEAEGLSVPDDVALVGYDDIPVSGYVGLTTIRQPMYDMGRVAVDTLLDRIAHPETSAHHTQFTPELVRRGSTRRTHSPASS